MSIHIEDKLQFIKNFIAKNGYIYVEIKTKRAINKIYDLYKNEKISDIIDGDTALYYSCWFSINNNHDETIKWLLEGCRFNNLYAMINLGDIYYRNKDYNDAFKYYHMAANQGQVIAMGHVGDCYYHGDGVERNYSEAIKWYQKAIDLGDTKSITMLGHYYFNDKNYKEAVKLYKKGTDLGDKDAMYALSDCYYDGKGVGKDYAKAIELCKKSAELGLAIAMFTLGETYYCENDYDEALKWYHKAAENNNCDAMCCMGVCYYQIKKNYKEAVKWYQKSLEINKECTRAMRKLGDCYEYGHGVEKDYDKTIELYETAATLEDLNAQEDLANLYYNKKDYVNAIKWYSKLQENGEQLQMPDGFAKLFKNLLEELEQKNKIIQDKTKQLEAYSKSSYIF